MAKYIVTGGGGFIGSHLVERLLTDGHYVHVFDNFSTGKLEYLKSHPSLKVEKIDICDLSILEPGEFSDFKGVFHLAAHARIQPSIKDPGLTHDSNVSGTLSVLEFMREAGVPRIVYSASSSVYGLHNRVPLIETDTPDCLNPYSATKYMGEIYCNTWSRLYGISNINLRYFNVYGVRSPMEGQYAPVVGLFFRQGIQTGILTVVGDGNQRRDFTHVSDVVEANVKAMNNDHIHSATINVGTGRNYSINEVAGFVQGTLRNMGKGDTEIQYIPARPGEAVETLANIDAAKRYLGWKPKVELEKLETMYALYHYYNQQISHD